MGIGALFDLVGFSLYIIALLLIPASVVQMLSGGLIIFTVVLSRIFFGTKILKHHKVGVLLSVTGFLLVGISSVLA